MGRPPNRRPGRNRALFCWRVADYASVCNLWFKQGRAASVSGISIRDRLLADRKALLDLGTRNRLINIPLRTKNIRAIEVVNGKTSEVFTLIGEGKRFTFFSSEVASPEDKPGSVSEGSSNPIPLTSRKRKDAEVAQTRYSDTRLQTRLSPEGLQKRLLDIWYDARTLEEEQGVNILYLAFGLLKWFEDDKSDVERFAPLVLLPVRLERSSAADRFHLVSRSEPPSPNLSLQAKMDGEFGLKIKDFSDEDEVDIIEYLAGVADTVLRKSRWEVNSDAMVLGFFSFSKFLMYRDLDPENWPTDNGLDLHPSIRALLQDGFESPAPIVADDDKIDSVIQPAATNHVIDADSSQTVAIEEVVRGRHLVIKGPPGTGKSQTITNIIASAAAQGRTVLFVAEKMAALDVVHRRLRDAGLASLLLELHSSKANKRVLLEELKRARGAAAPSPRGEATLVQRLTDSRDKLNLHAEMMHATHEPSGLTPFRLLGNLIRTMNSPGESDRSLDTPESWSPLDFDRRRELVAEIGERIRSDSAPHQHPWRGVGRDALDPRELEALRKAIDSVATALANMTTAAEYMRALFGFAQPATFAEMARLLAFAEAAATMPDCDREAFRNPIWNHADDVAAIVEKGERFARLRTAFESACIESAWSAPLDGCRLTLSQKGRSWFRLFSSRYRAQIALLSSYLKVPLPKAFQQRLLLVDGLIAAQLARRSFEELEASGRSAFGAVWRKDRSDWTRLGDLTSWWVAFPRDRIPNDARDRLARVTLSVEDRRLLDALRSNFRIAKSGLDHLIAFLQLDVSRIPLDVGEDMSIAGIADVVAGWRKSPERLSRWIAFMDRIRIAREDGLGAFAEGVLDGSLTDPVLVPTFERSYFEAMRTAVFAKHPELKKFDGEVHGRLVESFRKFDLERMRLARDQIAYAHASRLPRNTGGIGPLGVLNGEIAKKRNHLPIRQLLERAGPVIQQIKPIFLMSPLSIAQFLKPGAISFDLLVVDEASQIEPVDALGAVARCRQMVVVGDERQLPPTRFFAKLTSSDEDRDEEDELTFQARDAESILDLCLAKGLSHRMLNWHYRSKHQSLIAVSNKQFYDNRLFIVPSPYDAVAGMGLKFHYLPDAYYDRGNTRTNPKEARIVAEAVIRHARETPNRSLGVATFSVAQRQAVQNELELLRREHPDVEEFFGRGTNEPFFVKNLENVQGDERDVVFISVGYGKTEQGFISMSFGPLNSDGGERRLNVLISRAKLRCEVFSSITGDDIDLSRSKGRGVAAFKMFLSFAQTGKLGIAEETGRHPDSVFEEQVAARLTMLGHDVRSQIGTAGFFVDLAVLDSEKPGRFLLGIECDGAQYHSSRSARDRDRLRQDVLEAHGWVLHRIWSTDWFLRPEEETAKVVQAIEAAKVHWRETDEQAADSVSAVPIQFRAHEETDVDSIATEVNNEKPTTPPYEEAKLSVRRQVDPHETPIPDMVKHVVRVVSVEGPIHESEIVVRIRSAWGLSRAGNRIREAVQTAIRAAKRKKEIAGGPFYVVPGQAVYVRSRADVASNTLRKPETLPPEEIKVAIAEIVEENYGAERDKLVQAVARLLGFGATSAQLREVVEGALAELLDSGRLRLDGRLITRSQVETPSP
jgi:very-short-patch-repair endonuclease